MKNFIGKLNAIARKHNIAACVIAAATINAFAVKRVNTPAPATDAPAQITTPAIDTPEMTPPVEMTPIDTTPAPVATAPAFKAVTADVIADSGTEYQTTYAVYEISEVIASNYVDVQSHCVKNPAYPQELQPRDRANRVSMALDIIHMANNLRPADLMASRNLNQGAPVIRPDGVVLNGNGRTMSIARAYDINKAGAYRQALIDNAAQFGYTAKEISRYVRPVLVRVLNAELTADDIAAITESTAGGTRMGAAEQAQIDAAKIKLHTLEHFEIPENGVVDFSLPRYRFFATEILADICSQNDLNAYVTSKLDVNQDGISRVKRALFATAYSDDGFIAKMCESVDDNIKSITNALASAAPIIAKIQIAVKKGDRKDYHLDTTIVDAVKKIEHLRTIRKPVEFYLREQSMFGDISAESKMIMAFFDAHKRSAKDIAGFLYELARCVRNNSSNIQTTLWQLEELPLAEMVKVAASRYDTTDPDDLFHNCD